MSKKECDLIYVYSEWDIGFGYQDCFIGTIKSAKKEVKELYKFQDMKKNVGISFKKAVKDGLISFSETRY